MNQMRLAQLRMEKQLEDTQQALRQAAVEQQEQREQREQAERKLQQELEAERRAREEERRAREEERRAREEEARRHQLEMQRQVAASAAIAARVRGPLLRAGL